MNQQCYERVCDQAVTLLVPREEREEKLNCRRNLLALLQAEEDRRHQIPAGGRALGVSLPALRYVAAKETAIAREAEIMKDVPGWKAHLHIASCSTAHLSTFCDGVLTVCSCCRWVRVYIQRVGGCLQPHNATSKYPR